MKISIERINKADYNYSSVYTVHVEDHRILTVSTNRNFTVSKWLKEVQKTTNTNTKHMAPVLVVGVAVDNKSSLKDSPYDLLQLCIGSHCLLYCLPKPNANFTDRSLRNFFSDPKVIAAGMNMKSVAKKLEHDHEIKFENVVDLNELAVKSKRMLEMEFMDVRRYDLDKLAKAVLGKRVDVVRPEKMVKWFDSDATDQYCCCYDAELTQEKVKYATVDSYLCFMIGWQLLHLPGAENPVSASKGKKKKSKSKKK